MGKGGIPERWLEYTPIGRQIEGTRFIAFKVPLRSELCETIDSRDRLDIGKILDKIPNLGLVIDLTNTSRYYNTENFVRNGVQHAKLMVPGHVVPPSDLRRQFCRIVRRFLEKNEHNDKLIGVHCTHGVNRTGFFVCHHMITDLAMDPTDAIKRFEKARGHRMERKNYLDELYKARKSKHDLDGTKANTISPETWRQKDSSYPPRRTSQSKVVPSYTRQSSQGDGRKTTPILEENWRDKSAYHPPHRPSQNNSVSSYSRQYPDNNVERKKANPFAEENWRDKSSYPPPRRPSDNKAISSYSRQSSDNDSNSRSEKASFNPRNPFRRDPIFPTPTIYEGETLPKNDFRSNSSYSFSDVVRNRIPPHNHFNEERKVGEVKNPFKTADPLPIKDRDDYNRDKFRQEVYRTLDNERSQFPKRRRSPENVGNISKKGASKMFETEQIPRRTYEQLPERNNSTSTTTTWKRDHPDYATSNNWRRDDSDYARGRERNDSARKYASTRP